MSITCLHSAQFPFNVLLRHHTLDNFLKIKSLLTLDDFSVEVSFISSSFMKYLNSSFLKKDDTTDILAFQYNPTKPYPPGKSSSIPFPLHPKMTRHQVNDRDITDKHLGHIFFDIDYIWDIVSTGQEETIEQKYTVRNDIENGDTEIANLAYEHPLSESLKLLPESHISSNFQILSPNYMDSFVNDITHLQMSPKMNHIFKTQINNLLFPGSPYLFTWDKAATYPRTFDWNTIAIKLDEANLLGIDGLTLDNPALLPLAYVDSLRYLIYRHLPRLFTHSILHLLGHDHDRDDDFETMWSLEYGVLGKFHETMNPQELHPQNEA